MEEPDFQKMKPSILRPLSTPVLLVLGATGAGKSKLALELAQKFHGEIISADAMQMYKGLDIITNKVTAEERNLVKHHMIDFLDPLSKWTIIDFRNAALPIINDLRSRSVMPIICGGTNYYIESLIWKILIENESKSTEVPIPIKILKSDDFSEEKLSKSQEFSNKASEAELSDNECDTDTYSYSNLELYEKLRNIDPERANDLHSNERRKVIRSLEVYRKHKRTHSELLKEQKSETGGGILGGPLRFDKNELIVLWVQCDQSILDQRCDNRVDKMIKMGMLDELREFHKSFNENRVSIHEKTDYTNGIFQSIGFKEFHEYLTCDKSENEETKNELYMKGVEQLKLITRQYARKQIKWMRQRFLHSKRSCPPVYKLDSTRYPEYWDTDVLNPAIQIVESLLHGIRPEYSPIQCNVNYSHEDTRKMFHCGICKLDLKGKIQYEAHIKSKRHRGLVKKLKKTSQLIDIHKKNLESKYQETKVD